MNLKANIMKSKILILHAVIFTAYLGAAWFACEQIATGNSQLVEERRKNRILTEGLDRVQKELDELSVSNEAIKVTTDDAVAAILKMKALASEAMAVMEKQSADDHAAVKEVLEDLKKPDDERRHLPQGMTRSE